MKHVWDPIRVGPVDIRNRILVTAHSLLYGKDFILSDRHIAYYRERAMGGVGLQITEPQAAQDQSAGAFNLACTALDSRAVGQYRKLADEVHKHGARQFVQLFAIGVHDRSTKNIDDWRPLLGASAIPSVLFAEQPVTMEQRDIDELVAGYRRAAANVLAGGLDGVEIHGAHSYLVGQFLSPTYNKRGDKYGGSPERRCRLAIEVAEGIREEVGDAIAVGIRMSVDEYIGDAGITPESAMKQVDTLAATGLFDFFNITAGGYHSLHRSIPSMAVPEAHLMEYGKRVRSAVDERAKVFLVGRIRDMELAERVIDEGAADMVAMTRAHIADPQLVNKTRDGRSKLIVRCVGANACTGGSWQARELVTCMMNPSAGREEAWGKGTLRSADRPRRVVVVGAGVAGMRAAATASARGHDVLLLERSDEPGGHINLLKRLPTRGDWQIAIDNLTMAVDEAGVDLRLGTDATEALLAAERPDAIVCATGAVYAKTGFSPARPERTGIPGADAAHVVPVDEACRRALADPAALGHRVVIVEETGLYLPFGLADLLSAAGVQVDVATRSPIVGESVVKHLEAPLLFPRLLDAGVAMRPSTYVESIEDDRVRCRGVWGTPTDVLEGVDTVVISMLRTPVDGLYWQIRDRFPQVERIGDALAPRTPGIAIFEGERVGRAL